MGGATSCNGSLRLEGCTTSWMWWQQGTQPGWQAHVMGACTVACAVVVAWRMGTSGQRWLHGRIKGCKGAKLWAGAPPVPEVLA
jgi:hypothetical protein